MYEVESKKLLVALIAPPDPHMSKCTWHELYDEMDGSSGPSHEPRRYPLTFSGHVRSFYYSDNLFHDSFTDTFGRCSLVAKSCRLRLEFHSITVQ